jgi:adenine-specific DNA-methyltransferase
MEAADALVERTDARRVVAGGDLGGSQRGELGQFFTPARAAKLITDMPRLPADGILRVLDPGAGIGSLSASLVARVLREAPRLSVEIVAAEIDNTVAAGLKASLADCASVAEQAGTPITTRIIHEDLITAATGLGSNTGPLADPFDLVIMNPPYRKLGRSSSHRQALAAEGVDCPNLYCAFLALGVMKLKAGGQLVAITPRSFANGPYFGEFRRFFLREMALDRLHVFGSRSSVFADSGVLQENIIFSATRSGQQGDVLLSTSKHHADEVSIRRIPYEHVVSPNDPHKFIRFMTSVEDTAAAETLLNLPCTLGNLDIEVSTGRVVDFRARDHLMEWPTEEAAPLIYPGNLSAGRVRWPLRIRKAQGIATVPETRKLLVPRGYYTLVKRFSSKEERRRVVAAVYDPEDVDLDLVGFENHINVFHSKGAGLGENIARGLCVWLNSTPVDKFFRTFSGHTQVNATDLRSMRYPEGQKLELLGSALGSGALPNQEKIDALVELHVLGQAGAQ